MRAFRFALSAFVLVAGLGIATTSANAATHVYVGFGAPGYPVYAAAYAPACPGPGYNWAPAYYDGYGRYYSGRWVAEREWREHEWREHHDRDRDRDRYDRHDRDDRDDRHGDDRR